MFGTKPPCFVVRVYKKAYIYYGLSLKVVFQYKDRAVLVCINMLRSVSVHTCIYVIQGIQRRMGDIETGLYCLETGEIRETRDTWETEETRDTGETSDTRKMREICKTWDKGDRHDMDTGETGKTRDTGEMWDTRETWGTWETGIQGR